MLTAAELSRYGRQLALPEVGLSGQDRLRAARVLIVGAGGLGSPAALYLAAAGVGTIGVVDDDTVEVSNLHRQVLHGTPDIGHAKAESAVASLTRLNPNVELRAHRERLGEANAARLLSEYELVIDGSDNYPTRYVVNDACARLDKPWIYGSVERFSGQLSVFGAPGGPCYRCIFPEPPSPGSTASCEEIGVLGAVPGVVGSLQAAEALKWILGVGEPLVGRLLQLDLKTGESRLIRFERRRDCSACALRESNDGASRPVGGDDRAPDIEPTELERQLRESSGVQLVDIRDEWEWSIGRIAGSQLVPMNELEARLESLDRGRDLIVYCHHGVRSGMAAEWLRIQGFRARNLAGGIDRWSREIDASVPRY